MSQAGRCRWFTPWGHRGNPGTRDSCGAMTKRLITALAIVMASATATAYAAHVIPPDRYPRDCLVPVNPRPVSGEALQAGPGDNALNGTPRRDILRGGD